MLSTQCGLVGPVEGVSEVRFCLALSVRIARPSASIVQTRHMLSNKRGQQHESYCFSFSFYSAAKD